MRKLIVLAAAITAYLAAIVVLPSVGVSAPMGKVAIVVHTLI